MLAYYDNHNDNQTKQVKAEFLEPISMLLPREGAIAYEEEANVTFLFCLYEIDLDTFFSESYIKNKQSVPLGKIDTVEDERFLLG